MNGTAVPQWPPTWGITGALSEQLPDEKELRLNDSLLEELKKNNNFEAPEETNKRVAILNNLQKIVTEFVKQVGQKKGLSQTAIGEAGGRVFTFGSYRLGVYGPGSDIDTLLVAPKHVAREDFFEQFPELLHKMSPAGAIEDLKPVPDAFVPIIKLEYSGISIDLIFARLAISSVVDGVDLKNNELLRGLNDTEQRCLNGTRVTDEILTLVPQVKTFRHSLRAVKLWAQRRAIYANVMGFPGGVAWALMVARICQMYPHASGAKVIVKFFHLMSRWQWPKPIMLKQIEEGPFPTRIWNPVVNRSDGHHLMPIITPAFPSMCATHNVTHSTRKVIVKELARAQALTEKVQDGKLRWDHLFEKHTFFTKDYKYYLSVISASKTKEAQSIWSGLVESKVRRLISSIELAQVGIELARPFTKGFDRIHECKNEEEIDQVLQGSLSFQAKDTKTETTDVTNDAAHQAAAAGNADKMEMPKGTAEQASEDGEKTKAQGGPAFVWTTTYYIGIELAEGQKSLDISYSTNDFIRQCKEWQQYDSDLNSIRVVYTRNYDLPEDVFEAGEIRPAKTEKKKKSKATDSVAKKRSFSATAMDGSVENGTKRRQQTNGSATPVAG